MRVTNTKGRTHISGSAAVEVREVKQEAHNHDGGLWKPRGLWYEVDGDWRRWCKSEQPNWLVGKYLHRLKLGGERLLMIRTVAELDAFHERYATCWIGGQRPDRWEKPERDFLYPDWREVAAEYDGIEIAPYQWPRRLRLLWYYAWDCASGCIWRPRGARLALVGEIKGEK